MTVRQLHRTRPAWTYGDRLRKVRRDNHLTQTQLAEALGYSPKSIDAWESDRNLPGKLVETSTHIEDHFGLERGWMLGYADDEPPTPVSEEPTLPHRDSNTEPAGKRMAVAA